MENKLLIAGAGDVGFAALGIRNREEIVAEFMFEEATQKDRLSGNAS